MERMDSRVSSERPPNSPLTMLHSHRPVLDWQRVVEAKLLLQRLSHLRGDHRVAGAAQDDQDDIAGQRPHDQEDHQGRGQKRGDNEGQPPGYVLVHTETLAQPGAGVASRARPRW